MRPIKILVGAVSIFVAALAGAVPLDVPAVQVDLDLQQGRFSDIFWRQIFAGADVSESSVTDTSEFFGAVEYNSQILPTVAFDLAIAPIKLPMEKRESSLLADFSDVNRHQLPAAQYTPVDTVSFAKKRSHVSDPNSFFLLGIGILALAVARHRSTV